MRKKIEEEAREWSIIMLKKALAEYFNRPEELLKAIIDKQEYINIKEAIYVFKNAFKEIYLEVEGENREKEAGEGKKEIVLKLFWPSKTGNAKLICINDKTIFDDIIKNAWHVDAGDWLKLPDEFRNGWCGWVTNDAFDRVLKKVLEIHGDEAADLREEDPKKYYPGREEK